LDSVDLLLQWIGSGDIGLGHNSTSNNKFLNHSTSLRATAKATNSEAMAESVMQFVSWMPKIQPHYQASIPNLAWRY